MVVVMGRMVVLRRMRMVDMRRMHGMEVGRVVRMVRHGWVVVMVAVGRCGGVRGMLCGKVRRRAVEAAAAAAVKRMVAVVPTGVHSWRMMLVVVTRIG